MFGKEIKRFSDAFNGLFLIFRSEPHARFHLLAACVVIAAGFYFKVNTNEWLILILTISIVITAEAVNTAIEKLGDFVHKEKHESMRIIKDMAAGAVLFSAIASVVIAAIIFIPKIF